MKKDFTSGAYWDAFGRGVILDKDERATAQEASDWIIKQMIQIEEQRAEIERLKTARKTDAQQFDVFLMEVSNAANKYRR